MSKSGASGRWESLESRAYLAASPVLLGDLNQTNDQLAPQTAVDFGSFAYFAGRPSLTDGYELFKTDGTKAGTVLVKDIHPTLGSEPENLTNVNGTLFFVADDGVSGRELWKSDGTAAGTVRVVDLNPGLANASPALLTNVNGVLYFTASDGGSTVLWRTDGTAAGTQKVTVIGSSQTLGNARDLVAYNGSLLLAAGPSSSSRTLYRVDAGGSTASAVSGSPVNPIGLTLFNNAVYFSISGSSSTNTTPGDLWKTDGTTAGTTLVKAFNAFSGSTDYATTGGLTVSGNRLYFFTGSILNGTYALWGGDGTNANTRQLLTGSDLGTWIDLQPVGTNAILFLHTTSANGNEPWVSDGTVAGTTLLKDLVPGSASPDWFSPVRLGSGQALFTTAPTYGLPTQIWTTNGTAAGTVQQTTLSRVPGAAFPIGTLNGAALLAGVRFYGDGLLYRSDGTAAGTYEIPATLPGNGTGMVDSTSYGSLFATVGDTVYFAANDGITGVELWKSVNGGSPVRVADLAPNGADSAPDNYAVTDDGSLYFTATTVSQGRRSIYRLAPGSSTPQMVWATGTAGWTMISNLTAVGNAVFFSLSGGTTGGSQLWSYKPSIGAPYAVIAGGLYLSSASTLQRAGDAWYFGAQPTNANGSYSPVQRLFAIDRDGVLRTVTDIPTGTSSSNTVSPIGAAGNLAYFTAYTAATGSELWRTDGTAAGTFMVADVVPGTGSSDLYVNPGNPNLGTAGQFYFMANDAPGVFYRTDGSAGSLTAITGLTSAFQPVAIDGQVYVLSGSTKNAAVYRVQGSAATQVAIGGTGDAAFSPTTMFTAGGAVYLIGIGGDNARWELWRADASFADVQKVAVLGPRVTAQPTISPLYSYYVVGRFAYGVTGSDLYLPMYTDATGVEPYRISLGTTGSISGVVFDDANANGTQDPSEAPVAGDTLYLDANLNGRLDPGEATTVATASGYAFTGLTAGQYVVYRLATDDGRRQTSPFTDGPGGYGVALSTGGEVTGRNFGVTAKPPTAVANNATVPEGGQVALDGSASNEAFGTIATYEWDFNYDGATFDVNAAGANPLFDATSIDGPATRTVALRVTDANGLSAIATATVTIVNVTPTGTFEVEGGIAGPNARTSFGWRSAQDPSRQDQRSLKYSYDFNNDGDFTDPGDIENGPPGGNYEYLTPGVHTVHARLSDKDGAYVDQYALAVVRPPIDLLPATIEAETGAFTGGTAASTANTGYTGTGYADFAGLNSSATWSVTRSETTAATLTFRYANGGTTNRPLQIFVNGTSVGTLAFAPTGSWTTWATVSLSVTQPAGSVTIKAVATTSAGGANVDSLTLAKTPPAWLTASPGAAYTYTNGYLEVTSGVVTLTSDVGLASPDFVLAINGSSAKVISNTSQHLGTLYFGQSGTFEMAAGAANLLRTGRLHLGMAGRVNLNGSDMLIDSTAPENTDARSAILAGRASPMLNGIGTSLAQSDAARSLVYANADAYQSIYGPTATFRGEPLDNDFVVIKNSFTGDNNLDGRVDFNDFLRLQSNYGKAGRPTEGDTNFDGVIDFNDFLALQAAYGRTV